MKPTIGTRGRIYKRNANGELFVAVYSPKTDVYEGWRPPTRADRRDYLKAKKRRVGRVRRRRGSSSVLASDPFR